MVEQVSTRIAEKVEGTKPILLQFVGDIRVEGPGICGVVLNRDKPETFEDFKKEIHKFLSMENKKTILEKAISEGHDLIAFITGHTVLRRGIGAATLVTSGTILGVVIYKHFHDKEEQKEEKPD